MSDHKREVDKLRQEISQLDEQLATTLEKRARAARSIGELTMREPPSLPVRDRSALDALIARSKGDLPADSLRAIFREVQAACLGLEMAVRVAVVGPEGGAGHAAAREQFGHGATYVVLESPEAALDAVTRERAEFAVLPYETSIDGPVQLTILALSRSDLRIGLVRETVPTLHLFSRSGSTDDIVKVYATAADRALAGRSLGELARDRGPLSVLDVKSPLVACQLAQEEAGAAALANEATGAGVGLQIARRSMLDQSHGRVRYAVVGGRPSPRTGDDSTAVVFSLHDAPGALLEVLSQFAEREINLTRIQSRPVEADGWAYLFFIEVVGHATDRGIVSAFEEVKRRTKFFKVLGSYPARA